MWMAGDLSIGDIDRPLQEVARGLVEWQRGDQDDAVALTLDLAARNSHARSYVAWAWRATHADGAPAWLVPVRVSDAERFAPAGPVRHLLRALTGVHAAGAPPDTVSLVDWEGFVAIVAPGLEPLLGAIALAEAHGTWAARTELEELALTVDGPPLDLAPPTAPVDIGLSRAASALRIHPLRLVPALLAQGWGLEEADYPPEVVDLLRHRGLEGPERADNVISLAIEDDPCPRRRLARRLVRRLLHKRKIGPQYHTAIDHIAHGVAPQDRAEAYAVGEALLRAGILGEKPSVGQRHVYLRREALPQIHALVESGATADPELAAYWTCPPLGGASRGGSYDPGSAA